MTSASGNQDNPAGKRVREGWVMLTSQRPHAAWAIWQSVLQEFPDDPATRAALDTLAALPELPEVARKPLRFLPPSGEAARKRWDKALRIRLAGSETPTPTAPADAALAFRGLLDDTPDDAEALWNLAVCQAWMGTNRSAVETLGRFVDLAATKTPDRAADAWTLAELLRHGAGAEDLADAVKLTARLPEALRRDFPARDFAQSFGHAMVYGQNGGVPEPGGSGPVPYAADLLDQTLERSGHDSADVIATIIQDDLLVLVSAPASPAAGLFFRELSDQWRLLNDGERAASIEISVLPIEMLDAAAFRFRLPAEIPDERRRKLTVEKIAAWFENDWIEQPRHGLDQLTPLQASSTRSPAMRARLEGIIQFQEQLARRPGHEALYAGYDFDRLRYRLRLGTPPGKDDAKGETRHKALSLYDPDQVRGLKPERLTAEDLAVAWRTAFAVHDDDTAIRLGQYLARHATGALKDLSMADFVAPFLRRSLSEAQADESEGDWLDFAMKTDTEIHGGRDTLRLLRWKAELATRRDDAPAASEAWKAACDHPDAAPILAYEAVVDMWTLQNDHATALEFAADAMESTSNEYVLALLAKVLEPDEPDRP